MSYLKTVLLSVSIMYVVQFLLTSLAPEKYRSIVKTAASLLVLVAIVSSVVRIDISEFTDKLNADFTDYSFEQDQLILSEVNKQLSEYLYNGLSEQGIPVKNVEVITYIDEDRCISISIANVEIMSNSESYKLSVRDYIEKNMGSFPVNITVSEE